MKYHVILNIKYLIKYKHKILKHEKECTWWRELIWFRSQKTPRGRDLKAEEGQLEKVRGKHWEPFRKESQICGRKELNVLRDLKEIYCLESGEWCHMNLSNERGPKQMKPLRRHCLEGHPAMQPWVHAKGFQTWVWHCWTYLEKTENGRERRQEFNLADRLKDSSGSGKVVVSWTRKILEDIQRSGLIWKISRTW